MCMGQVFSFFKKKNFEIPGTVLLTWDLQVFSDFENVLIPQILILPSNLLDPPLQNLKKNLENPRYFFLTWDLQGFFFQISEMF